MLLPILNRLNEAKSWLSGINKIPEYILDLDDDEIFQSQLSKVTGKRYSTFWWNAMNTELRYWTVNLVY